MNEILRPKTEHEPNPEELLKKAVYGYEKLKAELTQIGINNRELQTITDPFGPAPDYDWNFSVAAIHLNLEQLGITEQSLIPVLIEDLHEIRDTLKKLARQGI